MNPTLSMRVRRREQGAAIVFSMAVVVLLASLSIAFSHVDIRSARRTRQTGESTRLAYAAEAGLNEAHAILVEQGKAGLDAVTYPRTMRGVDYWCVATYGHLDGVLDDELIRVVCVAEEGDRRAAIEGLFRRGLNGVVRGAYGADELRLDNNTYIDSWDSRNGTYASQAVNVAFAKTYARAFANTGSNAGVDVRSNAVIFGDAIPGPSESVSLSGGFVTGPTPPATETLPMKPVAAPPLAIGLPIILLGSSTFNVSPGFHAYAAIDCGGSSTLTIRGPATILTNSVRLDSNSRVEVDASGGPVKVYVLGNFHVLSNARMAPLDGIPEGLEVLCAGECETVELRSTVPFTGTIYAPRMAFVGDSGAQVFGAVMAREVRLDSNASIHVDEALFVPDTPAPGPLERLVFTPLSERAAYQFVRP